MRSEEEVRKKRREMTKDDKWLTEQLSYHRKGYKSGFMDALKWVLEEE